MYAHNIHVHLLYVSMSINIARLKHPLRENIAINFNTTNGEDAKEERIMLLEACQRMNQRMCFHLWRILQNSLSVVFLFEMLLTYTPHIRLVRKGYHLYIGGLKSKRSRA